MKLQNKFLLLMGGTVFLFLGAIGTYLVVQSPIQLIKSEQTYFRRAEEKILHLQTQIARLVIEAFGYQRSEYENAKKEYLESLTEIAEKVVFLPQKNVEVARAVETIKQLRDLSTPSFDSLETYFSALQTDAQEIFYDANGTYMLKFFTSKVGSADPAIVERARSNAFSLQDSIQNILANLGESFKTLNEKNALVVKEISIIEADSFTVMKVVLGLIILLALFLTLLLSRTMVGPLKKLAQGIGTLAAGDLTQLLNASGKDEIADLGRDLNRMTTLMRDTLSRTKDTSSQNRIAQSEMVTAIQAVLSSSQSIETNALSIRDKMLKMSQGVNSNETDVEGISQKVAQFTGDLAHQNENITESVAAVTQILASIDNIAQIAQRDLKTTEILVKEAKEGREVFEQAFDLVESIAQGVSTIQEMAIVISGIASQTNILSLNASIEAAHAGELGKGFAVVADEIGKLAASSARNSKDINETIDDIVNKLSSASTGRLNTMNTFDAITNHIHTVADSVGEIHGNLEEIRTGSHQVLNISHTLRETSGDLTIQASSIEKDTVGVRGCLKNTNQMTQEVEKDINQITLNLHGISKTMETVSVQVGELKESGIQLDYSLLAFKTS